MTRLAVWRDSRRVGWLETMPSEVLRFAYEADVVLRGDPADAVSVRCPVRAAPYLARDAEAVFENLLPEGALRDALGLATKHDVNDTVGLLGVVGGECAGALQLWPEEMEPPAKPRYEELTDGALRAMFTGAEGQLKQVTGRTSLSGAQAKLALWRMPPAGNDPSPHYRLPLDGAPTTVVVKRPSEQFPGLLEAELVGMRLMAAAGVPTASSARCLIAPACHESARFDRVERADGSVARLHAEDGCQITGRTSRQKYAGRGAPTYQELVAALERWSVDPLTDRENLFRWAVANAAMGNYDAHAKNVSVVYVNAERVRLAPAYDVVVTAVFAGLDQTLALNFGGTNFPKGLTSGSLRTAAREFRMTPARATELASDVVTRLHDAREPQLHAVAQLGGNAHMLERLDTSVRVTLEHFAERVQLAM